MEKFEKAMERRGASIVWAGRGYLRGYSRCSWRGFRELVPRCQVGGKLSTGTDRRYKKSGKGPPEPTDLQGSPGSAR